MVVPGGGLGLLSAAGEQAADAPLVSASVAQPAIATAAADRQSGNRGRGKHHNQTGTRVISMACFRDVGGPGLPIEKIESINLLIYGNRVAESSGAANVERNGIDVANRPQQEQPYSRQSV
jgi:hypothetical protein